MHMLPFSRFAGYFVEVARLGNLRKAAEVLHVSASAIDRQILLAESELQTELFERLPSGLKLTAAGELLLNDVRRWRKEYVRTTERLNDLQGLKRGHVSLAIIDALSEGVVARTLARLSESMPGLTFELRVLESCRIPDLIASAEVDFGLMLDPVEHAQLKIRAAVEIPMGAVMPSGHALASETTISFSRLLSYRHIKADAPLMVHERAQVMYARHGVDAQQALTCNDVRMIRALVRQGAGLSVLSLLDVASDVEEGRLTFVPLHDRDARPMLLALCASPGRQLSRAAQLLMQRLEEALSELSPRSEMPVLEPEAGSSV